MPKLLLVIVGMPGSGKSTAADAIAKKFNAAEVHSGDIIREEIHARGLEFSPTADMAIAHWFHTGGREKLVVQRVWERVKLARKPVIVIEGLRSPSQLNYLKELSGLEPVLIAVNAPFRLRYAREIARGRFGKSESLSYLRKRDKLELEHGQGKLIRKAKYSISNKGTEQELEEKAVALVSQLQG
jgi:dephospho-CoA kinase